MRLVELLMHFLNATSTHIYSSTFGDKFKLKVINENINIKQLQFLR